MTRNTTKRALLTSIIAMIICVVMLASSTFAWFTDSVVSGNNVITAGNLDVELEYSKTMAENSWESVQGEEEIFNKDVRWEPGYTEIVYLKVKNTGTLALKYSFAINIVSEVAGINVYDERFKLSDHIKFGVVNVDEKFDDREQAIAAVEATATAINTGYSTTASLEANTESDVVALVVYMPTTVGNAANHKTGTAAPSIELGLKLLATQYNYESDGFNMLYDTNASFIPAWDGTVGTLPTEVDSTITITTANELAAFATAVNNGNSFAGKIVKLGNDINLENNAWTPIGECESDVYFQGTFDGQGNTIYNLNVDKSEDSYKFSTAGLFGWIDTAAATIKNVKLDNATVKGSHWVGAVAGYMTGDIINCTVSNSAVSGYNVNDDANGDKVGGIVGYVNSGAGSLVDNTVINTTVMGNRDVAGIAGAVAVTNTVKGNTVKDSYVLYTTDYAAEIVSAKTTVVVDNTNKAENVIVSKKSDQAYYDDGTGVYLIADKAGLEWFASEVNQYYNYEHPFEGETIKLIADIDLGGAEWTPIGDYRFSANRFCGTFDGMGNTVSNFKITKKTDKSDGNKSSYGFFGNVEGIVKNFTVENATVSSYAYCGALIGRLSGGTVINCHVKNSTVECSYWQAGGMIGQLNDGCTVKDCTITDSTVTGAAAIGGMFGPVTATNEDGKVKELLFENCTVNNCAVIQKGSFGASYDVLFGGMFNDIDVHDNNTKINNCIVKNTTVKGESSDALYSTYSGSEIYIDDVKVSQ